MSGSGIGMYCKSCGSEWKNKSNSLVTKCPFCGELLPADGDNAGSINKEDEPPFDNSEEALKYVMKKYGAEVLLGNGDRLRAYLLDFVPYMEKYRRNVILLVNKSGAADILKRTISSDGSERKIALSRACMKIIDEYRIEKSIVKIIVGEFAAALGWEADMPEDDDGTASGSGGRKKEKLTVGQRNYKFGKYNWRVLDVESDRALLLSEEITERRAYHNSRTNIIWKDCDLRKYLNGEFLNSFSVDEQSRIIEVVNKNPDNQWYKTPGGVNTTDRIFILSIDEVVKYFGDSGALAQKEGNEENGIKYWYWSTEDEQWHRIDKPDMSKWCCFSDKYNEARIAKHNGEARWWWLRSPGHNSSPAAYVRRDGIISMDGDDVYRVGGGIRPALWINL